MLGVQMLRRGDQNGVDRFVVQQVARIEISLRGGDRLPGFIQPFRKNIGERDDFSIGTGDGFAHQLHAAVAGADEAEADAVVGAQTTGTRQCSGEAGGNLADEFPARMHGGAPYRGRAIPMYRSILAAAGSARKWDSKSRNRTLTGRARG